MEYAIVREVCHGQKAVCGVRGTVYPVSPYFQPTVLFEARMSASAAPTLAAGEAEAGCGLASQSGGGPAGLVRAPS